MVLTFTQDDVDRFMRLVDKLPNGCWFWTGSRSRGKGNRKWYGTFWLKAHGRIRAHRFACEALPGGKGECPPGHHRDHECVFSLCVNPEHIHIITHERNQELKQERRKAA